MSSMPSNHVAHYDPGYTTTPRPHKKKRHTNTHEYSDEASIYSTTYSAKAPSIVGLQNLRQQGTDSYIIESRGNVSYRAADSPVTPVVKSFLPTQHGQEGRGRTRVLVTVVVLKVGEIETIKEFFEADMYIQLRWREPLLDHVKTKVADFSSYWNPELVVQNVFEDPKIRTWHELRLAPNGEAFIYEFRRVKGKFFETMELNDFPFDIQSISVVLTSELTKELVEIVEDPQEISTIHTDCFSDSQEWKLHNLVEITNMDISAQYTRASKNYSGLIVTCCVSRRYGFFAWNVLAIIVLLTLFAFTTFAVAPDLGPILSTVLLTLFAFTTFAVAPDLTQNRLQLSFILTLAGISFRFVTNQSIPKISYLTHLDRYMMISTIFSGLITLWHASLSRVDDSDLQKTLDFWAFIVFAVGYFLFQLIFIFIMLYERRVKLEELRGKEDKYKNKTHSMFGNITSIVRDEIDNMTSHLELRRRSNIHFRPR